MATKTQRPQSSSLVVFVIIPIILAIIAVKLIVTHYPY